MKTMKTIPKILTANTYFWNPAMNASSRRRKEEQVLCEVEGFLKDMGFSVKREGTQVVAKKEEWDVEFSYRESCKNVYKTAKYFYLDRKTNLTKFKNRMANIS